ncbi:hypothetical protein AJ81_05115 [Pseudothermotoga hypogea DSM 11164 = NBRC 106472]|uniref:Uncharacterized protein n=1 Tax=Pseudothermotoga hypogea DSM 11164 = NBRC 106472 TaxID=1123384 RepID=A0A0X1KU05_9THEM|nr:MULTISPECIES: hypothetical protein [Pseudothermotoga]AJC74735.1 hypothetical protein AJ81_05115 [Pseudothermotoga hypogea DSM 11164 = NBRC 106472]MBC7122332.1 hypothetical protein [Pseudothermotoga sp.]MDI6861940.1 hypothetical protein [Pseudothermotoga sp.]
MTLLDNFTVQYTDLHAPQEMIKQLFSLHGPSFNSPQFGTFNVCLYVYQDKIPRILVSLVMFDDESLTDFLSEGIEFGRIKKMDEFKLLEAENQLAIIDVTLLSEELVIFQNGPRDLICLASYEKIKTLNREQLAKMLVEEYFRRFYNHESEYRVQVQDNSVIEG